MGAVKKVFVKFCRTTTIQGFRYIERTRRDLRMNWIILTSTMITICLWKCGLNLQTYLAFDVKTEITTSSWNKVDFPSITFCPQYTFKRSGISTVMGKEFMLAFLLANDKKKMESLVKEVLYNSCILYNVQ